MQKNLSEAVERKFVDSLELDDEWEIESDGGWVPITHIHKTIEYEEWIVETDSDKLICADTHILFDENLNEVFAKDLTPNSSYVYTKNGPKLIKNITQTSKKSNMFDVTVNSENHRFYSGEFLSHNTISSVSYILWMTLFNADQNIAILANKGDLAQEILDRYQLAYENLPMWLQQGVKVWNKRSIELENGSKIIASATSSNAIRGGSFTCVTGETLITICDDYGNIFVDKIENADSSKYKYDANKNVWDECMYYTIYKITNIINNKEYIGYHQTNDLDDGYMGSGKLIKRAIEKYGIENFSKEYIDIFNNREDAEALEALLVNEDYTLREDTYNICLGGNVRIMVGKNNPFYGKTHTIEAIESSRSKNIGRNITEEDDIIVDGIQYNSFSHAQSTLNITTKQLMLLLVNPNNGYVDNTKQKKLLEKLKEIEDRVKNNRLKYSILAKKRFTGIIHSEERNKKISISLTGRKKSEEHVNKINKNPEKIRKTAEKHKGMQRSAETKQKISDSKKGKSPHNKGKIYCYDPTTMEKMLCLESEIPSGWIRGFAKK